MPGRAARRFRGPFNPYNSLSSDNMTWREFVLARAEARRRALAGSRFHAALLRQAARQCPSSGSTVRARRTRRFVTVTVFDGAGAGLEEMAELPLFRSAAAAGRSRTGFRTPSPPPGEERQPFVLAEEMQSARCAC